MCSHDVISATRSHSRCSIRIDCFQQPLSPVASFPLLALGSDIPPMRRRWSEPTPASPPATEARKLPGYPGAGPRPWKGNQVCACSQKPELPRREGDVSSGGACFQNWFRGPQSLLGNSSQERRGHWPFFAGKVTACVPFTVPVTVLVAPPNERIRTE